MRLRRCVSVTITKRDWVEATDEASRCGDGWGREHGLPSGRRGVLVESYLVRHKHTLLQSTSTSTESSFLLSSSPNRELPSECDVVRRVRCDVAQPVRRCACSIDTDSYVHVGRKRAQCLDVYITPIPRVQSSATLHYHFRVHCYS